LAEERASRAESKALLARIVAEAEKNDIALTLASYLDEEEHLLTAPSIRLCVKYDMTATELNHVTSVLAQSVAAAGIV